MTQQLMESDSGDRNGELQNKCEQVMNDQKADMNKTPICNDSVFIARTGLVCFWGTNLGMRI